MKFLIAPDSFKECLSAVKIADIIASAIKQLFPKAQIIKKPMADGGEGFEDIIINNSGGRHISCPAHNALGEEITSRYGLLSDGQTAIIEMAKTSALADIPLDLRNPMNTSTFGMGEQILHAINQGCQNIVIGLGGSGAHDMGLGLLQALGFQFFDSNNNLLPTAQGAKQLAQIANINESQVSPVVKNCHYTIACDVANLLLGEHGAAKTYAPQKGATPDMVEQLEKGAANFANVIKKHNGIDVTSLKGGGAAGGVGAAMTALLGAKMQSGIELVMQYSGIEQELVQGVDLVITGEGKIDNQSLNGKVPFGIASICSKYNTQVMAFCGRLGKDWQGLKKYFVAINEISPRDIDLAQAIKDTPQNLQYAVKQALTEWMR